MSRTQSYHHWRIETDADSVLWLYFDKQGASVNTLSKAVMMELSDVVTDIAARTDIKGVIIASGKKTGFIAGADISEFTKFTDIDEAVSLLKEGQKIYQRIEDLQVPVVAMIDGFCLGGGMELALACHYRVAEDDPKTKLGLPEVMLGIHPGWGGTVRMPRLIGAVEAMKLMLTGRTVSAKTAGKLGLVDEVVPKRHLERAAKYYALKNPGKHRPGFLASLTNSKLVRPFLAPAFKKQTSAKAKPEHYPAPFQIIDNWERFGVYGKDAYDKEARSCGKLFFSETCQNLVRDFFLHERLKGLGKNNKFSPTHIHVIGAGTMGGDIAAWCALRGMRVTLQDREPKFISPALKRASKLFKDKLKEPNLVQQAMDRLVPDVKGYGIAQADVIVEAIFENLEAKQKLFKALEQQAKPHAVLATNTSSIPLDEINSVLENPGRLVGIHFFNPVSKMELVEVVKGDKTDDEVAAKAMSFVHKISRIPLPVKSSPGFLVNRILMPYLLEGVNLMNEGIPAVLIDKAMLNFGMPMGPVTLADTVGLDICLSVANYLSQYLNATVPPQLTKLVEQGKLGRKTGEGFYVYKNGKQIKPEIPQGDFPTLESISDRLVLRMLDEAFACLREGVVKDGDLLDAGMIFGTGFAPFRGGPIHYAKSRGIDELFQQYVQQKKERGEKVESIKAWDAHEETA